MPLKQQVHRLKIRLRKRAECAATCVLVVAMAPVIAIMLAMVRCGYEIEDDGQGCGKFEGMR